MLCFIDLNDLKIAHGYWGEGSRVYKSKIEPKLIHRGQSKATWEVSLRSKLKKEEKDPSWQDSNKLTIQNKRNKLWLFKVSTLPNFEPFGFVVYRKLEEWNKKCITIKYFYRIRLDKTVLNKRSSVSESEGFWVGPETDWDSREIFETCKLL